MSVLNYTTTELQEKQALILGKVDAGEEVIIHSGKNKSYIIIPIHESDLTISEEFKAKIAKAREDYKNGNGTTCYTIEESRALLEAL